RQRTEPFHRRSAGLPGGYRRMGAGIQEEAGRGPEESVRIRRAVSVRGPESEGADDVETFVWFCKRLRCDGEFLVLCVCPEPPNHRQATNSTQGNKFVCRYARG